MATEYLRPNVVGDLTQLSPIGAAANWDCVDETPANEDTDYVISSTIGADDSKDLCNLPAPTILTALDTIVLVRFWIRSRYFVENGTVQAAPYFKENGVATSGTLRNMTASYANYYQDYTTRPSDGGAWTFADIGALQIGVRHYLLGAGLSPASAVRTTQAYCQVEFTRPGGRLIMVKFG